MVLEIRKICNKKIAQNEPAIVIKAIMLWPSKGVLKSIFVALKIIKMKAIIEIIVVK
jgi:hypothetical protein